MAKTQPKAVTVEITRTYFRGKRKFSPGARIIVPDYAIESITKANPPFGKVVQEATKTEEKK